LEENQNTGRESRIAPLAALKKYWGYSTFRPLQEETIRAALAGRDALVVLPTGGGKSLCYQLPAVCGVGLVLVVSPLIALMDDQVSAAREAGVAAGALHSHTSESQRRQTWARLFSGELDLLYVSPERLVGSFQTDDSSRFFDLLSTRLGVWAIDEAHCVSHWGHEFRPEYRRLKPVLDRFPKASRLALTATATPVVQADIIEQLGLREPDTLIGHPDRPNLVYRAFPRFDQTGQVLEVIHRHPGQGGIVYAQTRREVERLAKSLAKAGVSCAPYHAGLEAAQRAKAQDDFVHERLDVIVATIAFGMGIDRSNVRFVVHANTPKSIEHYQQESGRAGRDGEPAECVLLFSAGDLMTHRVMAMQEPNLSVARKSVIDQQLKEIGRLAVAPVCRHRLLAEHFGQPYPPPGGIGGAEQGNCGSCDVCLGETLELSTEEALLTAQKIISAVFRTENRFGSGYVIRVLLGRDQDQRIQSNNHHTLRVFGLMKDSSEQALRAWVDQLVIQGYLTITTGEYPVLKVTRAGLDLCRGVGQVRLGKLLPPRPKKRRGRLAVDEAAAKGADTGLFEKLRQLRLLLARHIGKPPYVIFPDSALTAMATLKPADLHAFRMVKGVGDRKLEEYGRSFLEIIAGGSPEEVFDRHCRRSGRKPEESA
jgi:ATP-dependent DNA helicase RecQ